MRLGAASAWIVSPNRAFVKRSDALRNVSPPTSIPPASCGGPWTTNGGNSSPPPATAPSYMGVLVSSNVSKNGSTISGNTVKIVVVKVNPGYGPSPGSTGTGTVVGVFCP